MLFPYETYHTINEPIMAYYPPGEEAQARQIVLKLEKAASLLGRLLQQPVPEFEVLLVASEDLEAAPRDDIDETSLPHPYWTESTTPPTIVIPLEIDRIFGELTAEKFSFMLYHAVALAFLMEDTRPWPEDTPLWADEWQVTFAALWLSQQLDHVQGTVQKDLFEEYEDVFEIEPDGKTPTTLRSFDWYEDTDPEDYLGFQLMLEQFAADLLSAYGPEILPRFLTLYRVERERLLSDDVTSMLVSALGPNSEEWVEKLPYF
ncbi:hypothetical protein EI42_02534 [Thermosporothrix hazakensis]|jgi:hypothetical protein|uniref:Uncharacterized protein n=1 Tax=Thermosporothrix hazakensis TaxID=644383 RepID=A0A326U6Y8_THEHA|nr:hypothetical protein [Thermosporothrix hazakensis]PZW30563.1 hypothetical protein EI42_02534 [Thermosporothrix hazakensis]GCE49425.1 hypothetical protein KTH_42940 [Thermosporothrix hazakensis]